MSSENRKFEDEWKDAFADAEGDVDQSVWVNIDSKLANAESGAMKKRVLFYQWLAAASVVLAMVAGGVLFMQNDAANETSLAQGKPSATSTADSSNRTSGTKDVSSAANSGLTAALPTATETNNATKKSSTSPSEHQNAQNARNAKKSTELNSATRSAAPSKKLTHSSIGNNLGATNKNDIGRNRLNANVPPEVDADPVAEAAIPPRATEMPGPETIISNQAVLPTKNIAATVDTTAVIESPIKIAQIKSTPEPTTTVDKKVETSENWWASLNGSAGSYTTGGNATSSPALQSSAGALGFQNASSGTSGTRVGTAFSYGINVGKRIAPRWVIMSGIGYMTQSINYNSNSAVFSSAQAQVYIADITRSAASPSVSVASYELTSVNEFVTIPLQAGYLLMNRKVGVQLNAGVASDLFLRNTLSDPAGQLSTSSQSAGDASTYKTVNWTGLVGTELSYKISSHYRIAVIPGMRYSFDSILKSNVSGSITPLIWDVGFRFKYVF
ncbi:MAG: hypothetical protein ACKOE6_13635 [Flammeovirgaceae bacterium]